jgi:uncharacterized protein (DUF1778 family)
MPTQTANTERVDFRATPDIKALIERAAAIQGMAVSDYIRSVLVPASQQVIAQHETRVLSDRDRDLFLQLLDNPPAPNAALQAAAEAFKAKVRGGDILP